MTTLAETIFHYLDRVINDPTAFCEGALGAVYLLLAFASWRLRHRLHGAAYIVAALLVALIALHAALRHDWQPTPQAEAPVPAECPATQPKPNPASATFGPGSRSRRQGINQSDRPAGEVTLVARNEGSRGKRDAGDHAAARFTQPAGAAASANNRRGDVRRVAVKGDYAALHVVIAHRSPQSWRLPATPHAG